MNLHLVVAEGLVERLSEVGAHLPALHVRHQVALAVPVATQLLQELPGKIKIVIQITMIIELSDYLS